MQEQCVEEADGARHLVGENQPPLRRKQGVEGSGTGLTHSRRAGPGAARGGKGRQLAPVPLHRPGIWATGILKNGIPGSRMPESTTRRAVPEGGGDRVLGHTATLGRAWEGSVKSWRPLQTGWQVMRWPVRVGVSGPEQVGTQVGTHHAECSLVPGAQAQVLPLPLLKWEG